LSPVVGFSQAFNGTIEILAFVRNNGAAVTKNPAQVILGYRGKTSLCWFRRIPSGVVGHCRFTGDEQDYCQIPLRSCD